MKITYNEKNNEDFDLIICKFEIDDKLESGLSRTIETGTSNVYRYIPNHFSATYDGQISYKICFIKKNETSFSQSEIRKCNNWLMSFSYPHELKCEYDNEELLYNGIFNNVEYITASIGVVGLEYSFVNDSSFCYKKLHKELVIKANKDIIITCDSDLNEGYIYPIIKIERDITGEEIINIENKSDNSNTMSITMTHNLVINIDCFHQIITDDVGKINFSDLGWTDSNDIYWLRFIPGDNIISIDKDCRIVIDAILPLKVGVLYEY